MTSSFSVEVRRSGIWQMTSAVLSCDGVCLIVDPGYFPRELDELTQLAQARGDVTMVAFTHGHWDHVMGWRSFPDARVLMSRGMEDAVDAGNEIATRNLRDAADFDRRWYIERGAPPAWPPPKQRQALAEGSVVQVGHASIEALLLPGHSADGLALWARESGWLLLGDYLSPCEIPFVENLAAYRATLRRLLAMLGDVRHVLPGHGRLLSPDEARAIAEADSAYLDALARCQDANDAGAALSLTLPRAADVKEMQEHHRDNCRAAGLAVP